MISSRHRAGVGPRAPCRRLGGDRAVARTSESLVAVGCTGTSGQGERDRIDPAWVKRMAPRDSPEGERRTSHNTMQSKRLDGVLGTRGRETACLYWEERQANDPEELNQEDGTARGDRRRCAARFGAERWRWPWRIRSPAATAHRARSDDGDAARWVARRMAVAIASERSAKVAAAAGGLAVTTMSQPVSASPID